MRRLVLITLALVMLLTVAAPVSAGRGTITPDVMILLAIMPLAVLAVVLVAWANSRNNPTW